MYIGSLSSGWSIQQSFNVRISRRLNIITNQEKCRQLIIIANKTACVLGLFLQDNMFITLDWNFCSLEACGVNGVEMLALESV